MVYPILCYPFLGLGGVVRFGDDDDLESVVGLNDVYVECDIMVELLGSGEDEFFFGCGWTSKSRFPEARGSLL